MTNDSTVEGKTKHTQITHQSHNIKKQKDKQRPNRAIWTS